MSGNLGLCDLGLTKEHVSSQIIIGIHALLYLFDGLPFLLILFSMTAHVVYLTNFTSQWPFISLTSIKFLASCCMVVADHFLWFFHFAEKAHEAKTRRAPRYRYGANANKQQVETPSFMDVAAFFAICVWLVPLFLFLSLSANDNVLPQQGECKSIVFTLTGSHSVACFEKIRPFLVLLLPTLSSISVLPPPSIPQALHLEPINTLPLEPLSSSPLLHLSFRSYPVCVEALGNVKKRD